jgi:DNA-directed RNA polymerase specialized sigma24 family protein
VGNAFDDARPDSAKTSPETPLAPPGPQAMASELATVSRAKMRELFDLAYSVAMAITKSKARSDDIVQTTFERLMTTRRWDGKKPIEAHVVGIVKSLVSNQHQGSKSERKAEAHDGFHREVVGQNSPSPEERTIEKAMDEARQTSAAGELEQLAAKVAAHPLAPRVLQKRADGLSKPADIARALGVSVDDVYRANDVLRRNLRSIRKDEGKDGDNDEEEM